MSKSRATVETAYGLLDSINLQKVQDGYDTLGLLRSIDELDELVGDARGEDGLRDILLRLHAMAHTLVNGAPMAISAVQDGLAELATEVTMQLHQTVFLLQKWIRCIEPLANLAPDV